MLKTPLTKESIKHHFQYSAWKYLLAACLVFFGVNLLLTTTAYRSPPELKVDLYVCFSGADQEALQKYLDEAHEKALPDMEEVRMFTMMSNDGSDAYTVMQLSTYIMAGEGDIYLLSKADFDSYAAQGAMLELTPFIQNGQLNTGEIDLEKGRAKYYENENSPGEEGLYGIPADEMFGLWEYSVDNRGMVFGVMAAGKNHDNAIKLMDYMIGTLVTPMPTGSDR